MSARRQDRNTAPALVGVVVGMGGLAYAAVPLYQLFCQVTGYGGTTQRANAAPVPADAIDRFVTIRFDANVGGTTRTSCRAPSAGRWAPPRASRHA